MRKSQFVTFILSVVPGLGHMYLGLPNRGLGFMAAFFGWALVFGVLVSGSLHGAESLLFFAPLPIIWFCNMADALALAQRINQGEVLGDRSPLQRLSDSVESGRKDPLWVLLFSVVPGAGQMYLGWQDRGFQLMLAFFISLFLADSLGLSLFLFVLPVIWFYSFFDAMQLASASAGRPGRAPDLSSWVSGKEKWVGLGLVALGCVVLFDRIVVPLLHPRVTHVLRTGMVAAVLIGSGIRLAMGERASAAADSERPGRQAEEAPSGVVVDDDHAQEGGAPGDSSAEEVPSCEDGE